MKSSIFSAGAGYTEFSGQWMFVIVGALVLSFCLLIGRRQKQRQGRYAQMLELTAVLFTICIQLIREYTAFGTHAAWIFLVLFVGLVVALRRKNAERSPT
jgi:hypothetical protein